MLPSGVRRPNITSEVANTFWPLSIINNNSKDIQQERKKGNGVPTTDFYEVF